MVYRPSPCRGRKWGTLHSWRGVLSRAHNNLLQSTQVIHTYINKQIRMYICIWYCRQSPCRGRRGGTLHSWRGCTELRQPRPDTMNRGRTYKDEYTNRNVYVCVYMQCRPFCCRGRRRCTFHSCFARRQPRPGAMNKRHSHIHKHTTIYMSIYIFMKCRPSFCRDQRWRTSRSFSVPHLPRPDTLNRDHTHTHIHIPVCIYLHIWHVGFTPPRSYTHI